MSDAKPTKLQVEALCWLIAREWETEIPANALMVWYEERARVEHAASNRQYGFRPTTNRRHAWRRTSGRVLGAMERAGLLAYDRWDRYSPKYKITDAGKAAAAQ